jgi:hypothetical protein
VTEYAPGASSVLRTFSHGIATPDALEFAFNRLYVANQFANTVTVYSGKGQLLRTINEGVSAPSAIVFGP